MQNSKIKIHHIHGHQWPPGSLNFIKISKHATSSIPYVYSIAWEVVTQVCLHSRGHIGTYWSMVAISSTNK